MIPAFGPIGAARIHKTMAERTADILRPFSRQKDTRCTVHYTGGSGLAMRRWLGPEFAYHPQGPGTIGDRMSSALRKAFLAGSRSSVLIGSDCPSLQSRHIREAFLALGQADVVLGPSRDGGYYLIALRTPRDLFTGIPWSTSTVLERTEARARRAGLRVARLETLPDVDEPKDVPEDLKPHCPWLSVIVPTRNESRTIADTLQSIRQEPVDVRVVDGQSEDDTPHIVRQHGVPCISCLPGRWRQLNRGAQNARGEVFLFCHADTALPEHYPSRIFEALCDPHAVGGAFRFALNQPGPVWRIIEWATRLRSHAAGYPYGDQGLFVRSDVFRQVGGFPIAPLAEDLLLVRRLRREGRLALLDDAACTSARRWQRHGLLRTTLAHQAVFLGTLLGADMQTLARLYRTLMR